MQNGVFIILILRKLLGLIGYAIPDEEVLTKRILQKTEDKPPQKNRETNMFGSKKKKKVKKGKEVGNSDERCPTCSAKLAYCICNADSEYAACLLAFYFQSKRQSKISLRTNMVAVLTAGGSSCADRYCLLRRSRACCKHQSASKEKHQQEGVNIW